MKIQKKHVWFILLFIFSISIIYIIVASFFSNNLSFKSFYVANAQTEKLDNNKFNFLVNENNEIICIENDKNTYYVYKLLDDDVEPKPIVNFDLVNVDNYNFIHKGTYYYMFYNNDSNVIVIDINKKSYNKYEELPDGKKIINPFDDNIYLFEDNKLYLLDQSNNLNKVIKYDDFSSINFVKSLNFISENELVVSNYESMIKIFNIIDNTSYTISEKYQDLCVYDNVIYYTYIASENELGIGIYKDGKETKFKINRLDYVSMKVKDDYIYLIAKKDIYKVSISRQKKHETLELGEYLDSTYSLQDIEIVNHHLMYIRMIKEEMVDINKIYKYYIYRYKV